MVFRSGYIAIVGRPNVGKSTLLNQLVGENLAIVTDKPQTTRNKILGILHLPDAQLLFLDTPGIHKPQRSLNSYMVDVAKASLSDADVVLFVIDPKPIGPDEKRIFTLIEASGKPYLLVVNKVDSVSKDSLLPLLVDLEKNFPQAKSFVPIAALKKDGLDRLLTEILAWLPEGPAYYSKEDLSDQTERFLVSELIREQIILATKEEIPYAVAVVIDEYKEPSIQAPSPSWGEGKGEGERATTHIAATIHVEKDSQKGILIGKGGQMLRTIGEAARKKIAERIGTKVYLKLFVRVTPHWSSDPNRLKELGYG